jgi:hypothetical protein
MALAMLAVSALANGEGGSPQWDNCRPVIELGIFETEDSMMKFPPGQDTNIDSLVVGNDKALAYGNIFLKAPRATANNNLEIEKNQDSGACPAQCCKDTTTDQQDADTFTVVEKCKDCCTKVNVDQIKVGNRDALAFGNSAAANNVKICADQR